MKFETFFMFVCFTNGWIWTRNEYVFISKGARTDLLFRALTWGGFLNELVWLVFVAVWISSLRLSPWAPQTCVTWPSPPRPASDRRPSSAPSGWPPAPPPSGGSGRSCFSSHRCRNSRLPLFNQFSQVSMFLNTVPLMLRLKPYN